MPLAVFGDVDEESDQGDGQPFSPHVANRVEVFRVGGADDLVVAIECGVNGRDQSFGRLIVIVFAAGRRQLRIGKLAALGIRTEAVRTAGEMFQMKSAGAQLNRPARVLTDLLARAEQVAADGIELLEYPAEPGLGFFGHDLIY